MIRRLVQSSLFGLVLLLPVLVASRDQGAPVARCVEIRFDEWRPAPGSVAEWQDPDLELPALLRLLDRPAYRPGQARVVLPEGSGGEGWAPGRWVMKDGESQIELDRAADVFWLRLEGDLTRPPLRMWATLGYDVAGEELVTPATLVPVTCESEV